MASRVLGGIPVLTLAMLGAACRPTRSGPPAGDSTSGSGSAAPDSALMASHASPDTMRRRPRVVIPLPQGGLPARSPAPPGSLRGRARAELVGLATSVGRDTAALAHFARDRAPQLRFCFAEYGLPTDSTLAGRLRVWARTDSSGRVSATTSTGSGPSWRGPAALGVQRCASERVRSWKYHSLTLSADTVVLEWQLSVAAPP